MNSLQSIHCIAFANGKVPTTPQTNLPTNVGIVSSTTTQILVSFTAPSPNSPATSITSYSVRAYDGSNYFYGTGTSSPISVTGLSSGTQYTCTVSATNNTGGVSSYSTSNAVTYTLHAHAAWTISTTSGGAVYTANGSTVASTSAGAMNTAGYYIDRANGIQLGNGGSTKTTYGNFNSMVNTDFRTACTFYLKFAFMGNSYNQSNSRAFTFCQNITSGVTTFINVALASSTQWQIAYYEGTTSKYDSNYSTYTQTLGQIYHVFFTNNGSGSQTLNIYKDGSSSPCITQLTSSVTNSTLFNNYAGFFLSRNMFNGAAENTTVYYANILPYNMSTTTMGNISSGSAIP